jgi:hypothetical protein
MIPTLALLPDKPTDAHSIYSNMSTCGGHIDNKRDTMKHSPSVAQLARVSTCQQGDPREHCANVSTPDPYRRSPTGAQNAHP